MSSLWKAEETLCNLNYRASGTKTLITPEEAKNIEQELCRTKVEPAAS